MATKIKKIFPLVAICPLISSCYFFSGTSSDVNPSYEGENTIYKEPSYGSGYSSDNLNITNVGLWNGQYYLPSTGEREILVIPIQFTDDTFTTTELERIELSFFGEASDTGWESVKSYYEKSSYGKLSLQGDVVDPVTLDLTVSGLESRITSNNTYSAVVESVLTQALSEVSERDGVDLSKYDTNNDYIIDAVWLVYSAHYNTSSDIYWAFTSWSPNMTRYDGVYVSPYSWASVDFLTRGGYSPVLSASNGDAHTFIHETGHLLGLDDYYSYDTGQSGIYDSPTGGTMMMDYNIGDHDAYSKYALGWTEPSVVDSNLVSTSSEITLRSFGSTGDSLIIPIYNEDTGVDFNGTPFDEYLIVQYYTPDGLNSLDSMTAYEDLRMFSQPGILVYHVNSRVGMMVADSSSEMGVRWQGYCYDQITDPLKDNSFGHMFYYIYSNTRSFCLDTNISDTNSTFYRGRLLSLLSADGAKTQFTLRGMASNRCLFQEGDKLFGTDGEYNEFVFDDGSKTQYGFTVTDISAESCTIRMEAL